MVRGGSSNAIAAVARSAVVSVVSKKALSMRVLFLLFIRSQLQYRQLVLVFASILQKNAFLLLAVAIAIADAVVDFLVLLSVLILWLWLWLWLWLQRIRALVCDAAGEGAVLIKGFLLQ